MAKKGAERLTFNLAGKPQDPFGATNPINEFHAMLGDLDAWTKDIARENKILGESADTHAYDKCYVPLRREPGERASAHKALDWIRASVVNDIS